MRPTSQKEGNNPTWTLSDNDYGKEECAPIHVNVQRTPTLLLFDIWLFFDPHLTKHKSIVEFQLKEVTK